MLYAGFICQQQEVMSSYMSLHVSTSISATVLDSVCQLTCQVQYLLVCQMLYLICYVLYAGCHMPRLVCQFLYLECHVLVVTSLQSDQLYAYLSTSFCMLYARSHMPVTVYLHLYAGTWVPNICCDMPSLLICQLQYVCIYMPAHGCLVLSYQLPS
jgi:hypothetical protein